VLPLTAASVYLFKTLDARTGLTISQINCVMKDSRGYIWLGTPAGLYRYDGYTFHNFQSNSHDGSSLPDSYIISIQETLEGTLWIETSAGYCIYHPQTENFERDMKPVFQRMGIEGKPNVVFIDSHKNVWVAIPNKGVVAYNMQQQTSYEFPYRDDAHGVPQGVICSISECRDGAIIVYTDGRMVCCDIMHQQHTVWQTDLIAQQHLRKSKSLRAFADQMDNIWLYGQGTLMMYNKSTNVWDTNIGNQLGLTDNSVDHAINGMAGDRKGNIWIGSDRVGLVRTNISNIHEMEYVKLRNANNNQQQQEATGIQSLYIDDTDLLWVGTEKSGLAFYGDNIYKFDSDLNGDITAIAQDKDGKVWYGTGDKGIVGYDGQLASQKVSCMTTTNDGSLWVGSKQNGLTRIKDGVSTFFSASRDDMRTLIDDHVNALRTDKTGNLWIATNGGLQVYNPKMNTFSSYTRENGMLNTNNITSLFYGKNNNMLIGTAEGLVILNLSTREKTVLTGNTTNLKTFTNNYITQIYEDSRGLLWIGTREGINILDRENDELSYVTEKDGLCNNSITGITEDKNHSIWVTTSNGVSRIVVQRNHEDGTFNYGLYNYSIVDGLQSNEFNMGAILTRRDSTVLLGGLYGVNWARKSSKEQASLPRVMLTQLFIGEKEIQTGVVYDGNVILPQALNESNHVELANSQNTFTIKFSAGNYNQGERLLFMYWMEGLDNDWRNGDALLHGVKFQNLSSGDYTLHVKAVSADGGTSNQERTLTITIDRPWWMSWWMLTIYVIIAILILAVWRFGIKKIRSVWERKKTVVEELKRQREEIKVASDELRQPMARMTTIIGNLAEREQTMEGREQLNSLHFQMLQIITRISEMQGTLENPEKKATASAKDRMELNDRGELLLPEEMGGTAELAIDVKQLKFDEQSKKFSIVFIDNNREFLKFVNAHLRDIYNFHAYSTIKEALPDIETLNADIVVCKQDMGDTSITGSELCNQFKSDPRRSRTKFVLMTDGVLSQQDMTDLNITLAADDYLAKPFNMQEAIIRFNKLVGLAPIEFNQNVIEGKETRMLEGQNASMTTATMTYDNMPELKDQVLQDSTDNTGTAPETVETPEPPKQENTLTKYYGDSTIGDYSMSNIMDQQLMRNVEQFVLQNMSRGQISLEEMASAMGMGRVPFFHKIRNITAKTPAEVVRELRLKHACTLLVTTNINMSELALNVGFMTAENFINIFKEKYGMTPLEYRLKNKR
jgi:ligand-binding sensor domain-containing protein/AraC-like DNA-binding protein